MSNTLVNCRFEKSGVISLDLGSRLAPNLVRFEDLADRGDLYTPSLGGPVATPHYLKHRVVHKGPLVGEVRQRWKLTAPAEKRGAGRGELELSIRLTAGSPLLEVLLAGVNQAPNHRLRIGIATGVANATVVADAAFGPVERAPVAVGDDDARMEQPPRTAPLHRYVSLFSPHGGATVYSDGLAEYEVDTSGTVWITLLRSVGNLSRNDLPERPGHAGWPVDTPAAQSIGPFEARFGLLLHGSRTPAIIDEIESESDRFLHPLRGFTLRSAIAVPKPVAGPELSGTALAFSAMKQSEDGEWLVLRCTNLVDREQTGRWAFPRAIKEAKLARLDETSTGELSVVAGDNGQSIIEFIAGPRAVVTILVR